MLAVPYLNVKMEILLLLLFLVICFVLVVSYAQRSEALKQGTRAPPFVLIDQHGNAVTVPTSGQAVVLAFFPRDPTPRCLGQLREYADCLAAFQELGYAVYFVAIADQADNAAFTNTHHIGLPILADANGKVSRSYGSIVDFVFFRFAKRTSYVIDRQGLIVATSVVGEPSGHAKMLLDGLPLAKPDA